MQSNEQKALYMNRHDNLETAYKVLHAACVQAKVDLSSISGTEAIVEKLDGAIADCEEFLGEPLDEND